MTTSPLQKNVTMAALAAFAEAPAAEGANPCPPKRKRRREAATQPARVHGRVKPGHPAPNDSFRSQTLACWVAGPSPAMVGGVGI
jgi:hypothetical protein